MNWDQICSVAASVCFVAAALLTLTAGIGMLRFPSLLARMHAGTKPQVLGLMLALLGVALRVREARVIWMVVLIALFQMLTAPIAAHMVGRAAYRGGITDLNALSEDDLSQSRTSSKSQEP